MLQLQNHTRFAADLGLLPNEAGIDTLYLIVKASFNIAGPNFTLADEQTPPQAADVYWTEPGKSSIKYASDLHIGKPATDIVMLGHACAPDQREVTQLDVGLTVGQVSKTVRVFGDRQWQDGRMTSPTVFKTMPLVYERAYGGVQITNGQLTSAETRNPVGRGFAGTRKPEEMNGVPLPNLEDPKQLIRDIQDQPTPAAFGFCAPNWQPRASFAGTYDDAWQKTRAPYLPADFDKRFFNMAHPDLVYPGYLEGGEPVTITHMHPDGVLQFDLPRVHLIARVGVARRVEQPGFHLETLVLEPNLKKLSLVWRAALACDKKALKIGDVQIGVIR